MKVFLSWSGPRSKAAAVVLRTWLPQMLNAVQPWMSDADISSGKRWRREVEEELQAAKFGILCLTPSNLHSDWMLFEAGALAKTLQDTQVCPLLFGLKPPDLTDPLGQFQARTAEKEEIFRLLTAINENLSEEERRRDADLRIAFEAFWPNINEGFADLPDELPSSVPFRPEREILEEVLMLTRAANRPPPSCTNEALSELGNGQIFAIVDFLGSLRDFHAIRMSVVGHEFSQPLPSDRLEIEATDTRRRTIRISIGPRSIHSVLRVVLEAINRVVGQEQPGPTIEVPRLRSEEKA